jgi:prepilin-type N-terminal cleavage/methylation domain-containing protein
MRTCRGFTLIEVLATMLLLGIVLPVAMRGVSLALAASENARHTSEATALGEAKLNELVASGEWSAANGNGDFGTDFPGYRWTFQSVARDYGVSELAVTVSWDQRGGQRSLVFSTLVFDTSISGS